MTQRSLDPLQDRAWRAFHRLRTQLVAHLARQLSADCGLTEADYAVLVALSESPSHRLRSRELCRVLGWERSRLSRQISRMEGRGTVEREPCEYDARGFDVILTRDGLASIRGAAPQHLADVQHCFADVLSRQQLEALIGISDAINEHLEHEHGLTADSTIEALQK